MVRLTADVGLLAAVQFLTRIPVRLRRPPSLAAAVLWFPVVGALVGAAVGGTAAGLAHPLPVPVATAVAVLLGVIVTGAFHEDGLADVADAFAGGWTTERRLEILKDPRHGSYGVAALSGSIVLRIVCLASMAGPGAMFAAAVAAHALGRGAAVAAMGSLPVASASGLGVDYARSIGPVRGVAGGAIGLAVAALVTGWWVGPLLAAAVVGTAAMGWLAMRKIGGVTGDVLGAIEQVTECLALVVLTAASSLLPLS